MHAGWRGFSLLVETNYTLTLFLTVMLGGSLIVMELNNLTYKQVQVAKSCQQIYKSHF
jgi:hypothetical protein